MVDGEEGGDEDADKEDGRSERRTAEGGGDDGRQDEQWEQGDEGVVGDAGGQESGIPRPDLANDEAANDEFDGIIRHESVSRRVGAHNTSGWVP